MPVSYSFTCKCCGKTYELHLCFGSDYPYHYHLVPPEEREKRVDLTESLCVIDGQHFFHRGRITIPINDYDEDLIFNVWTSLSQENFEIRNELWNDPLRILQHPYLGWLQTVVPTYSDTINIKTIARENEIGLIPSIEVIEEGHPLRHDQRQGISFETALNKVQEIMQEWHKG